MTLCPRHRALLCEALELRGLLRPERAFDPDALDAFTFAHTQINRHAEHLAGRASFEMLAGQPNGEPWCALCFVNGKNGLGLTLDGWVNDAAEETLAADLAHHDHAHEVT